VKHLASVLQLGIGRHLPPPFLLLLLPPLLFSFLLFLPFLLFSPLPFLVANVNEGWERVEMAGGGVLGVSGDLRVEPGWVG
jgi:hypothetical protein